MIFVEIPETENSFRSANRYFMVIIFRIKKMFC